MPTPSGQAPANMVKKGPPMLSIVTALLFSTAQVQADGGVVYAKGKKFLAEVARTPKAQEFGLMRRQTFKPTQAMFFLYSYDDKRTIWMKNCLISLDVVWIDADGNVVEIAERCPPCSPMRGDDCPSYGGKVVSRHFVEFSAGTVKRLNLKVGDRIGWDLAFIDGTSSKGGPQGGTLEKTGSKPKAKSKSKAKR